MASTTAEAVAPASPASSITSNSDSDTTPSSPPESAPTCTSSQDHDLHNHPAAFTSTSTSTSSTSTSTSTSTSSTIPRVIVIGAGSRGNAYARPLHSTGAARILAVAEPRAHARAAFGRRFIWGEAEAAGEGQAFVGWREWVVFETARRAGVRGAAAAAAAAVKGRGSKGEGGGDGDVQRAVEAAEQADRRTRINTAFVCVLDDEHLSVVRALAPLGLHIMCEKPLATTLGDCLDMYAAVRAGWRRSGRRTVFGIGHVLRYSPHNVLLRRLVREERVVGDVLSVEHTEPVGWWHFTHSYVRGNWRRQDTSAPSLLTKSCHDIDFLLWLLSSPTTGSGSAVEPPHLPSSIASTGSLRLFRTARKPVAAGKATNCLSCAREPDCSFSAKNVYITKHLHKQDTGWPLKIVVPEIEDLLQDKGMQAAEERVLQVLQEDYTDATSPDDIAARTWYGRCVYESDNDVCDDQTVTIEWADDALRSTQSHEHGNLADRGAKTALFHMVAFSEAVCARRGRIYGTAGEITYDSNNIAVYSFETGETRHHHVSAPIEDGHGGGDQALAGNMARAVAAAESGEMTVEEAQWVHLGVDLEEVVRSHAAVFAAEEARRTNQVLDWRDWWAREVDARMRNDV